MNSQSQPIKEILTSGHGRLSLQSFVVISKATQSLMEVRKHLPAHMEYIATLETTGQLLLAGPLGDHDGDTWSGDGQLVFICADLAEAQSLAKIDPLHSSGVREYSIRPWIINVGSMRLSLKFSTQTMSIIGSTPV
jgi:uncharacterized protein YciI